MAITCTNSLALFRIKCLQAGRGGLFQWNVHYPPRSLLANYKSQTPAAGWQGRSSRRRAYAAIGGAQLMLTAAIHCMHPPPSGALEQTHDMPILSAVLTERPSALSSFPQSFVVLADLDPGTAKLLIGIMGPFLSAFGFLFILRIVMSWYPKLPVDKFPYVLVYAPTEPILSVTRKLIAPVGGVDVTPVVWFGLISFLNEILLGPQGLLVLLSQQVQ